MRQIYLVTVWILSVWALPKPHPSPTSNIIPSVTPPPCPCLLVHDGDEVRQPHHVASSRRCIQLDHVREPCDFTRPILLCRARQTGIAQRDRDSEKRGRWGAVLGRRSIHERSGRDDDDNDDDGEDFPYDSDGDSGGDHGSKTRVTAKNEPAVTRDSDAESTTEAVTITITESEVTAEPTTTTDKTAEPTSNTASATSTASETTTTTTTSETRSTTAAATTTSTTSTTSSTAPAATRASGKPSSNGRLDKSAIAAGSVFSAIVLIALIFLGIMYFRRARKAWNRRKQDRLSPATSRYSAVPLVEEDTTTKAALAQNRGSPVSDRVSLMFSRSRSPSVTFAIEEPQDRNSISRVYYRNGDTYVPLEQVDTSYQESREVSAAPSRERSVNTLPISVVVIPPPDSPGSPASEVTPPRSAAVNASTYSSRQVNRDSAHVSDHSRTDSASSAKDSSPGIPLWLPPISRSVSPILDLSRHQSQH